MKKLGATAAIIAKNAELTIARTILSLSEFSEIVVLDDNSTDNTIKVVQKLGARVISANGGDFAQRRSALLKQVKTDWVFYIDADEVVTPELVSKISDISAQSVPAAYKVKRRNFFLGREMYADYVDRFFHLSVIKGWSGKVHESPVLTEPSQSLQESLLHFTHTSIESMLTKTNQWSEYEADLRIKANHPQVAWWRLIRIGLTFFIGNYFGKKLWKYGREGLFEAYFQMIDKLIVYTKLWERQRER